MEVEKPGLRKLSVKELDNFFALVSMDLPQPINSPSTHMIISTPHHKPKKFNQVEQTPMIYFQNKLVSAQRVAYFLYHGIDVRKKSHLFLLCGESNCVNPTHLIYLATPEERKEFVNK